MNNNCTVTFGSQSKIRQNFWNIAGIKEQYELAHAEDRERIPAGYGRVYFGGNNSLTESGLSDVNNPVNCCADGDLIGGSDGQIIQPKVVKPNCTELVSIDRFDDILDRNSNFCDVKNDIISGFYGKGQHGEELTANFTCNGTCSKEDPNCSSIIINQRIKIYRNHFSYYVGELLYCKNVKNPSTDIAIAKAIANGVFANIPSPSATYNCPAGNNCHLLPDYYSEVNGYNEIIKDSNGCEREIGCGWHAETDDPCDWFKMYAPDYYCEEGFGCSLFAENVALTVENGSCAIEFNNTGIVPPPEPKVYNFINGIFVDACYNFRLVKCFSIFDENRNEYTIRADAISDINKLLSALDRDVVLPGLSNTISIKGNNGIITINGYTGEVIYANKF